MIVGDCNVCINGKLPPCNATCIKCGMSWKNFKLKLMTHADKFRSMSDEELAEYFPTHASLCPDLEENKMVCKGANFMANDEMCRQYWLNWLKQDAQMDVY